MRDDLRDPVEVAVVIPTYNCAGLLPRAIESVFAQSYRDYRVFVIDDGSTDGTDSIIEQYADCITYVRQPHAGAAAARNQGISISRSRYVAFLDADDLWLPAKLERQLELLNRHPEVGLVGTDFSMNGTPYTSTSIVPPLLLNGRNFEHLIHNCFICTPAAVVRRQCLDEIGCFNESLRVSEDYNLWLRIASRWPVAFIPEVLVHCHSTPGSLSSTTGLEERMHYGISALEHVLATSAELSPRERRVMRRLIDDRYYSFGSYLLVQKKRRTARHFLAKAWRARILNWKAPVKLLASILPSAGLRSMLWLWRKSLGG